MYYKLLLPQQASTQGFWRHPRSKHWYQLYLILFRRASIKNVFHTRSYHSADCDTDHSLVCCKVRMQPKKFHCTKKRPSYRCQQDVSTLDQTSWSSSLRPSRRNLAPCNLVTLPQRSGKLYVTLCTALLWIPLERGPSNHMTGSNKTNCDEPRH